MGVQRDESYRANLPWIYNSNRNIAFREHRGNDSLMPTSGLNDHEFNTKWLKIIEKLLNILLRIGNLEQVPIEQPCNIQSSF